ncbi:MAG: hypothetical protein MUE40_11820 [Anaerolineae bacterium]|jgi:hypothetical protein|nr:hypothetical protein [Anaerolineae bacterium]
MPRKVTPVVEEIVGKVEDTVEEVLDNVEKPFDKFLDHQKKAFTEAGKAFSSLLPEGLREHGENALKEMVEGYRTLFNSTLDEVIKTIDRARVEVEKTVEKVKLDDTAEKVTDSLEDRKN